ncbi:MAG: ABC transporter ATP-binding protein [Planctomycetaceae bacterium]|nr:ABC transporter ATP-binding protein [Planctomycetaceae bacterium]
MNNITTCLQAGRTAVIGYSGAGKSSLISLLIGMEPPTAGEVRFQSPVADSSKQLPVFWVPQDGGLWPHLTSEEHLAAVLTQNTDRVSEQTDKLLQQFDLIHRRGSLPGELSEGERSRLAVARCLAARPAVMLMDEPLSHVDPMLTPKYWNVIRETVVAAGSSLVFATHHPEWAVGESEFVICMKDGGIVYSGKTTDLYSNPPSAELGRFLGPLNWFDANEVEFWFGQSLGSHQTGPNADSDEQNSLPATTIEGATLWAVADDEKRRRLDSLAGHRSLRPEEIRLQPVADGPAEVTAHRFFSSHAETQVKHVETQREKQIVHRPGRDAIRVGDRIRLLRQCDN